MIVFAPDALADVERLRAFLDQANPGAASRAMAAILMAIERLREFPDSGMPTGDVEICQIIIRFGASGYIARYAVLAETGDIVVTRIWHAREARV
jgi:toxin ParE1/3/4